MGMRLFRASQDNAAKALKPKTWPADDQHCLIRPAKPRLLQNAAALAFFDTSARSLQKAAGVIVTMKADIRSLTGVRGVAAVIIVIYHYGKFHLDHVNDVWAVPHGYLPVDLF